MVANRQVPGLTILSPEDEARIVAPFLKKPWPLDPSFRPADPFGRPIRHVDLTGLYNIDEHYLVIQPYADLKEPRPYPQYGMYEDVHRRLVYQYIQPALGLFLLGRANLSVERRPPSKARELYLARFSNFPLPSPALGSSDDDMVRSRLNHVVPMFTWPSGPRPGEVRDAMPGEIIQTEDQ